LISTSSSTALPKPKSKRNATKTWTREDDDLLYYAYAEYKGNWGAISDIVNKTEIECRKRIALMIKKEPLIIKT